MKAIKKGADVVRKGKQKGKCVIQHSPRTFITSKNPKKTIRKII